MARMRLTFLLPLTLLAQEHSPERERNPFANQTAAIAAGKKIYDQTCQACHGGNGRGNSGPALNGTLTRGNLDGEIFLNIRNGLRGTQMPGFPGLKTDQLWQLVTYVRSLNAAPAASGEAVAGNARNGEALFGKHCAACHEINAAGGVTGPELSNAGRHPAAKLREKIVNPAAIVTPPRRGARISTLTVRLRDGRMLRGVRRAEDTFTLHLADDKGQFHILAKTTIANVDEAGVSMMPKAALNAGEIDDVVAYLKAQNGRDLAKTAAARIEGGLTHQRMVHSAREPQNWFSYWGSYDGKHYSALDQINTRNAGALQVQWAAQLPGDAILQSTPVVVDGVMYTAGPPGEVFALDARTGLEIWRYQRKQKTINPYESNRFNRGVAVLGNRVFFGTLDAWVIALDARTGRPLWETQMADTMQGYAITAAPLAIRDKIIVGMGGGEYGVRGFLDAYDAASGKRLWRFHTTAGPGEFGNDTWSGDSWARGGAATWLTGSYDAESDTVYWTTGNPGPDMNNRIRQGDNLFSCSVVALDPNTGKRKWHYQFTPNDSHDWDSNEDVILFDREYEGRPRKLMIHGDRNGFLYLLDRTNGTFLKAWPLVKQTWNAGFDEKGRPMWAPNSQATPEGQVVFPSLGGATNWQSPSYDAETNTFFVVTNEAGQRYFIDEQKYEPGKAYWGGRAQGIDVPAIPAIKAFDATSGQLKWRFPISAGSLAAGVLATKGGVLFAGTREGNLLALDSKTGALLWKMQTGGTIASSPMSYAVDGKQFVAISAGGVLYSLALP
ncbi:MAG: PQQ-dependent dehydrogenase, methanol/ethanol family [Acidobacteria bacterium]|nr:PQQ-dependent dehydrogenase, methanol/ethanol family [Acidobacteriota bacterium]